MVRNLRSTLRSPAYQLIRSIARRNWPLLAINLSTNLCSALFEGSTLAVVYLAISFLSQEGTSSTPAKFNWLLSRVPVDGTQMFLVLLAAAVLLQVLLSFSNYCNKVSAAYFSARAQPQVTGLVFEQIMSFSFGCASRYKVGDLIKFAMSAAGAVNNQITTINGLIVSLTFVLTYSLILISLSPLLAVVALALALTIAVVQRVLVPKISKVARHLMSVQVETAKYMTESIQGLRLLHTFGTQAQTVERTVELLKDSQDILQRRARLMSLPESVLEVLPILALTVLAAIAYSLSDSTEAILPMLLTFLLGLQRLAIRLRGVANAFTKFADNTAGLKRLNSILNLSDKEFYEKQGRDFEQLDDDIRFENVALSYTSDQTFALKNLTFKIPKNKVTALVGQSGAGKSSIVDLLLGLYQPTHGRVMLGEADLRDYSPHTWQRHVGVVSQDTFIFNCSILDNLRYGRPTATLPEVIEVAKTAQAHQFILDLPDGYNTVVGERGYRLSGGQRQRLALARAILKEPEILILDEATSALDSESERLIREALLRFQQNRTVVVIAHRLSTITEADQILVLDKGQIVEQGDHRELIHTVGRYARYWSLQTQ
ncbi:ABC transporter ATP-binding protein [cf. Phormidesmis sp. LEGE 11477]|nr:ABC transporter ATP-binding protein [cf. Phormidesmis sp. LEGE 11477]